MTAWRRNLWRLAFLSMTREVEAKRHFVILNADDEQRQVIPQAAPRHLWLKRC